MKLVGYVVDIKILAENPDQLLFKKMVQRRCWRKQIEGLVFYSIFANNSVHINTKLVYLSRSIFVWRLLLEL